MRRICAIYWLFLTVLLVVRNPASLLSASQPAAATYGMLQPLAHLICFFGLGYLAFAARLPVPRAWLLAGLVAYSALTEIVQGFVGRTPELADFVQDVTGLGAGAIVCWSAQRVLAAMKDRKTTLAPATAS